MKNILVILVFLLAFLSSTIVFAMAEKPTQQITKTVISKTSSFQKVFNKKIKERKAIRLLHLPTRYVFNSILMIFAELQNSISTKKQENTKQKSSEIISFILRFIGVVSIIALLITLVLLVLWLITVGTLGISIWLILGGIGLFTGLIFLSVLIIEKVLNEQLLRC